VCIQDFVIAACVCNLVHIVQEEDVEHYEEGEAGVQKRVLRPQPYLDPDSALEQLIRNEGGPEHAVPTFDGRCVRRCMCLAAG